MDETVKIKNDETKLNINLKVVPHVYIMNSKVLLKDVASIECVNKDVAEKVKQIQVHIFLEKEGNKNQIEFFSVLKLIELIHREFPYIMVNCIGETEFIVEQVKKEINRTKLKGMDLVKLWILCIIIFFGSAFTIMAFHNDIAITSLLGQFYSQIMGKPKPTISELEISYSIGIAAGILVFFNHLGKKKFSVDPTPIQVEMTKFKGDMDKTMIENATQKGHTQDVS